MVINCNNIPHLDGYTNGVNVLQFAEDKNGNKILGVEVLTDPAFAAIKSELEQQPKIDYIPKDDPI